MIDLMFVGDVAAERAIATSILRDLDFQVEEAHNALDALARCARTLPHAIILDSDLGSAIDLIGNLRLLPDARRLRIVVAVETFDLRMLAAARIAGADDFLLKPFDRKVLSAVCSGLAKAA